MAPSGSATPRSEAATTVTGTLSPSRDASPGAGSGSAGTRESSSLVSRERSSGTPTGSGRARRQTREARLLDGKYVLGEELGRGSSGKVYRALNKVAGQIVAIKEIPLVGISNAAAKAVQGEVELLHRLKHPQIVRFYETIRTADHLYLVLEYVENGSLASLLKTFGKLPEHMLIVFMRQVLIGLEWLHAQGICHRDIKGANLLTTKEGQVKLADFGVAGTLVKPDGDKAADNKSAAQAPVGTPYWMAPEIIQMSAFTTASDIWSLGCTILELLTGEPPYFDLRPVNALYRIVQDTIPPIPPGLSPQLDNFLRCCFERDPELRATAAQLRHHAWLAQEVLSPSVVAAAAVGPERSSERYARLVSQTTVEMGRNRYDSVSGGSTDPDARSRSRTGSRSGMLSSGLLTPTPKGASAEALGGTHVCSSGVSSTGSYIRGGGPSAVGSLPSESSPAMLARGQVIPRADSLYTIESTSPTSSCPSTFSRKESRPATLRPPSAHSNSARCDAESSPPRLQGATAALGGFFSAPDSMSRARIAADGSPCASSPRGTLAGAPASPSSGGANECRPPPSLEPIASVGSFAAHGATGQGGEMPADRTPRDAVDVGGVNVAGSIAGVGGGIAAGRTLGDVVLSGYLWKRGASWFSFAYKQRFFFLQDDELGYVTQYDYAGTPWPNGGATGSSPQQASAPRGGNGAKASVGERRIRLSSIVNIRVSSKVKFEFELVCTDRSFRLRAPSAQALAMWVTTISAEWMRISQREASIGSHLATVSTSSRTDPNYGRSPGTVSPIANAEPCCSSIAPPQPLLAVPAAILHNRESPEGSLSAISLERTIERDEACGSAAARPHLVAASPPKAVRVPDGAAAHLPRS